MATTYVVAREGKGNWTVEDNNGAVDAGFKNWVEAVEFARKQAVADGATVVRLSAKTGEIVEHLKPRVSGTSRTKKVVAEEVVEPDSTIEFVDELVAEEESNETLTEADLLALGTGDLVAIYNNVGGNITGKFKGARKDLVKKILANQAA